MDNLDLYNKYAQVPESAKSPIKGGKLSNKTNISPMWRIKCLTEEFGPCGVGWKYTIDRLWTETSPDTAEVAAFAIITLYYKQDGKWSEGDVGIGGNRLVAIENSKPTLNDEAYKSAVTDAISVACKNLGFGANVYWEEDTTKYSNNDTPKATAAPKADGKPADNLPTEEQIEILHKYGVYSLDGIGAWLHKPTEELTYDDVQMAINAKLSEKKKGAKKSA